MNVAIHVPGLGDDARFWLMSKLWRWQGVETIIFQSKWKSSENYNDKLKRLLDLIDEKAKENKVSLLGTSAGGSLVVNAFGERKDRIHKVITTCSRLRPGQIDGFRGFESRTDGYPAFKESVIKAEKMISTFSLENKQKLMTIHALYGDELVPENTVIIDQAKNITVPTFEHMISIFSSLTIFSQPLIKFIVTQ